MSKVIKNRYIDDASIKAKLRPYSLSFNKQVYLSDNFDGKFQFLDIFSSDFTVRLNDNYYFVIVNGQVEMKVNNKIYKAGPRFCIVIPALSAVKFISADADIKFCLFRVSQEYKRRSNEDLALYQDAVVSSTVYTKEMNDHEYEYTMDLYKEFHHGLRHPKAKYAPLFVRSCVNILHAITNLTFEVDTIIKGDVVSRQENTYRQFIELLNLYASKEREVQFYADMLGITPKYLSNITVTYSGKNASKWICDYVINLAIDLMREKKCKIQEVSTMLNFPSQSFFGRYFKRATGIAPKRFSMTKIEKE